MIPRLNTYSTFYNECFGPAHWLRNVYFLISLRSTLSLDMDLEKTAGPALAWTL